jgi:uncharacterized protein (TIGR03083 family)
MWEIDIEGIAGTRLADFDLIDRFREGCTKLVHTLASAPLDLDCFAFLPATSPLAMWARRQAHETARHRVDAESPGSTITEFNPAFAADGVDELLSCFMTRPHPRTPKISRPSSVHVHAADTGDGWYIEISPEAVAAARRGDPAGCTITASADELCLLRWTRRSVADISVDGDRDLLNLKTNLEGSDDE